jgi:hypothetical protein
VKQLAATQLLLQAGILAGDCAIEREIQGEDDDFRSVRLGIYHDAYRLRLVEVLGKDYPVLRKYLGDESFDGAALAYLTAHPSTFRNVRWFGRRFAEFLRSTPPHAQRPMLAELAQFEWSLGLAFDAAESEPVRFEEVAAVPAQLWPEMRFLPQAALHVLDLSTNAVAIWKKIAGEDGLEVQTPTEPVSWALWRKDHTPFFRSLERDEAWALKALLAYESFESICDGLCQWTAEGNAAARAAGVLRNWVDEGWIAKLAFVND